MELGTKRFLLRDFVDDDIGAYESYHSDARFLEYYGEVEAAPDHARHLVERFQLWAAESPRRNYQFAVMRLTDKPILVGCAGLRCSEAPQGSGEIGIEMAPQYWGRYGYAGEILAALARLAFDDLALESVYGKTVSGNSRIGRLMAGIGAEAVERPTPAWMSARGWHEVEWRLSRQQWRHSRLARRWDSSPHLT